jgi:hypothetical protein
VLILNLSDRAAGNARRNPPMTVVSSPHADRPAATSSSSGVHRWLLFIHQLPAHPSNLRVRTWRRLQQLGALAVKQAVYALPDSANAREDFEWLRTEIEAAGGHASVFVADTVDTGSNDALIEEFRRCREDAYRELAREALKDARFGAAEGPAVGLIIDGLRSPEAMITSSWLKE